MADVLPVPKKPVMILVGTFLINQPTPDQLVILEIGRE